MKSLFLAGTAVAALTLAPAAMAADKAAVLSNYSDIAEAKYADSLATAKVLQAAVNALVAAPVSRKPDRRPAPLGWRPACLISSPKSSVSAMSSWMSGKAK